MAEDQSVSIRLLLADGNRVHAVQVLPELRELGHPIDTVETRAELVGRDLGGYALVVVGEQLQDARGVDVVRMLAEDPAAPPVIALLDDGGRAELGAALAAGAADEIALRPGFGLPLRRAIHRGIERRDMLRRIAELEHRLNETSRVDAVSGLYTASYFRELLGREVDRIRRYGGQIAILRLAGPTSEAIDRQLGQHVRDRVRREVGALLLRDLRLTDLAGCEADGSFLVALTGTDVRGADQVAARLQRYVEQIEERLGIPAGLIPRPTRIAAGDFQAIALEWLALTG